MTDDERKLLQQCYISNVKLIELLCEDQLTQEELIIFLGQYLDNTASLYEHIFSDPKFRKEGYTL